MPKVTQLPIDGEIKDGDYVILTDAQDANKTKRGSMLDIKTFVAEQGLDGYAAGRLLMAENDKFYESHVKENLTRITLADGTATEIGNAIVADSSVVLSVGSGISTAVFNNNLSENDLIVITNLDSGERDFGVIDFVSAGSQTITLKVGDNLSNYTEFTSLKGFKNRVELIQSDGIVVEGDITLTGSLKDENGNDIVGSDIVTLGGNNTFTGTNTFTSDVTIAGNTRTFRVGNDTHTDMDVVFDTSDTDSVQFHSGFQIGDTDSVGGYRFPLFSTAPADDQVLSRASNGNMEFNYVNSLLQFGTDSGDLATWTQYGNTDKIPSANLPTASTSVIGAIKIGTNLSVASDGTLNATSSLGTLNITDGTGSSDVDYDNATDLKFAGNAVTSVSENGSTVTVTIAAGNVIFGTDEGDVAAWAEGDDTSTIPVAKIPTIDADKLDLTDDYVWKTGSQTFEEGLQIGNTDDDNEFKIGAPSSAPTAGQAMVYPSTGNTIEFVSIPHLDDDNTFDQENSPIVTTYKRTQADLTSNTAIASTAYNAHSAETNSYQDFIITEGRFFSDSNYEYGRLSINTNYVQKSNDTFMSLEALTIDRNEFALNVDADLKQNVRLSGLPNKAINNIVITDAEGDLSSSKLEIVNLGDSVVGVADAITLTSSSSTATLNWNDNAIFEVVLPTGAVDTRINMQNAVPGVTKTIIVKTGSSANTGTITLGTNGTGTPTFRRLSVSEIEQGGSKTNYVQVTCIATGTNEADTFIWTTAEEQS